MLSRTLCAVLLTCAVGLVGCTDNKTKSASAPIKSDAVTTIPPAPEPYVPPTAAAPAPDAAISIADPGTAYVPPAAAAPAPKAAKATKAAVGKTYTVQKGDTLMSISKKTYGTAKKYKEIAAANNITDVNKIKVGQVLTLP